MAWGRINSGGGITSVKDELELNLDTESIQTKAVLQSVAAELGGDGKALEKAKVDTRHVIQIEWFTYPVSSPMASHIGVVHSVLAVAVGDKTTLHKHVLEKA